MYPNILTLLTAALAVTSTSAQVCTAPFKEALAPCICQENNVRIYCGEDTDLSVVFERAGALLDENFVFDDILITGQGVQEFPANMMGIFKFRHITVEYNTRLNFIHPDAFSSTYNVTTSLTLGNNKLISNSTHHDLFTFLNKWKVTEAINLQFNEIRHIPDNAFPEPMPNLKVLRFGACTMNYIGSRLFANMPALESVQFGSCDITLNELATDVFEGIGPNVVLGMTFNPFSRLPEEIFRPVLDNAKGLYVGGEECYFVICTRERLDCDEEANWICEDVATYEPKLDGFYCKAENNGDHIWEYCDRLNNKNSTIIH